jgi:hypothetical protein
MPMGQGASNMPVHDWTRVDAGIYHDFHNVWIAGMRNSLNEGLLPEGYYALTEQHAGRLIPDLLTLHVSQPGPAKSQAVPAGTVTLADAPPRVQRKLTASASLRARRRSLAIRHVSGHQLVALIEVVSPSNKDRRDHVDELANKIVSAVGLGVHVMLIDLLPPGNHDPHGIHGAVWTLLDELDAEDQPRLGENLTLASYVAGAPVDAYLVRLGVGSSLPEMPLFLQPERYVNVPLEATYEAAFRGTPRYYRDILEPR